MSAANGTLIVFILLEIVRLIVWLHIINLWDSFSCMFIKNLQKKSHKMYRLSFDGVSASIQISGGFGSSKQKPGI